MAEHAPFLMQTVIMSQN